MILRALLYSILLTGLALRERLAGPGQEAMTSSFFSVSWFTRPHCTIL